MFKFVNSNENEGLNKAIDAAILKLATTVPGTEEHRAVLDEIERLHKLKAPAKEPRKRVSPDALIGAVASIAGIVLVANAEHVGAFTSKAFSIIPKPKI
ncbi:hypothetical protein SEA_TEACUP_34 [Arthrobacter phage Teacup]|uniref:Uncharacterized protein n=1 Tax=Arthrobacter phage Teacup TaxID=2015871 RepID=A0A222ZI74_9CAUD|nr:hypothetical protein QCN31_gp34 [Arthrobacter phage Teacup]ASR84039.1 hypothetical protein SEA_TEACUP_34 [Arthrobacter phage Teacup]